MEIFLNAYFKIRFLVKSSQKIIGICNIEKNKHHRTIESNVSWGIITIILKTNYETLFYSSVDSVLS